MVGNPNIHIFECGDGTICEGEYGNGAIAPIKENSYPFELW